MNIVYTINECSFMTFIHSLQKNNQKPLQRNYLPKIFAFKCEPNKYFSHFSANIPKFYYFKYSAIAWSKYVDFTHLLNIPEEIENI